MEIIKTYIVLDIEFIMGQRYETLRKCHVLGVGSYILEKSNSKSIEYVKLNQVEFEEKCLNFTKDV
jgi:hypothetical protein